MAEQKFMILFQTADFGDCNSFRAGNIKMLKMAKKFKALLSEPFGKTYLSRQLLAL